MTPADAALRVRVRLGGWVDRLRASPLWPHVPLLLLLLALASVFVFGHARDVLYRPIHHTYLTVQSLKLAANLSPAHDFLMFLTQGMNADGTITYIPYNRFPIGGYLLLKLIIRPFSESLAAQILAARMMMLVFYAATALLAYLSMSRLAASRWVALTATLLTFSSWYFLYYNDMVSTDNGLGLFGVMLAFHGMVVFVQDGRFRQLLLKACAALLLDWHVYALVLPFIILGLAGELFRKWRAPQDHSARNSSVDPRRARPFLTGWREGGRLLWALLRNRYLTLGVVTLLFGLAVLGFNFVNEYRALNGEVGLTDLPSFNAMRYRAGFDPGFTAEYADALNWGNFLASEFYRIGGLSLPFGLPGYQFGLGEDWVGPMGVQGVVIGAVAVAACLIGLAFVRERLPLAALASTGFFWVLPFRHSSALHDFESMYHLGIPLVVSFLGLRWLQRSFGVRLVVGLAAAALLVFVFSSWKMSFVGLDVQQVGVQRSVIADVEEIRRRAAGKVVYVDSSVRADWTVWHTGMAPYVHVYFAGLVLGGPDQADVIVTRERPGGAVSATPENQELYLFDLASFESSFERWIDQTIAAAGEPLVRGAFDVYRHGADLWYVANAGAKADPMFFLHVEPVDPGSLAEERRRHGFDNRDFQFDDHSLPSRRLVAKVPLPAYSIAAVRTGQYVRSGDGSDRRLWEGRAVFHGG